MNDESWLVIRILKPGSMPTRILRRGAGIDDVVEILVGLGFIPQELDEAIQGPIVAEAHVAPALEAPAQVAEWTQWIRHATLGESMDRARRQAKAFWVVRRPKVKGEAV